MNYSKVFTALALLTSHIGFGQAIEYPIEEAVEKFIGKGIVVSNIELDCPSTQKNPIGYFEDSRKAIGLESGILLTTGSACNAFGPNDSQNTGQDNFNPSSDTDLSYLVSDELHDACILEFDFSADKGNISFKYVFGSEEYPEYVNYGYNDVFGFFITGDFGNDTTITKNLALVPGTDQGVSIDRINANLNASYYVDNGTGTTPQEDSLIQYDGYTKPLIAETAIIPNNEYHLKIAISDVGDGLFDSGIFLEFGSFSSYTPSEKVASIPEEENTQEIVEAPQTDDQRANLWSLSNSKNNNLRIATTNESVILTTKESCEAEKPTAVDDEATTPFIPVKAYDIMGREVHINHRGEMIIQLDKEGRSKKIYTE